jgi:hypothetical protein
LPENGAEQGAFAANGWSRGVRGQAFEKLKVLLDTTESEWMNPPAAVRVLNSSSNHRPDRAAKPANDRAGSAETLDGPLNSQPANVGFSRPVSKGRSKVRVAVLTGYSATGGGFNSYLGALRSRGMFQGDEDGLTITDSGIQGLGS